MRASRGLKWENKMYKPKRSIHGSYHSFIDRASDVSAADWRS